MNPEELPNLQKTLLEFFAAEQEMKTLQSRIDLGTGRDPKVARALEEAKKRVAALEPMANEAKIKIREGLSSGLLAQSGGKIVLASEIVPDAAAASALKTSVRGTETLAAKGEVDPAELEASTARAKAEAEARAAAEREAVAKSSAADEARRKAELEKLAALPEEPAAPKPARDPLTQATAKAGAPELPKSNKAFGIAGGFVRPEEAPASGGAPVARTPPDVTRIEEALGRKADDQFEYLKLREELVKKFGVATIGDIPQTPEAERVIEEFVGVAPQPRNKGRFGSAPKAAAAGPETPAGGSFTPVPAGRKGVIEAAASDPQMKARRALQAVNFKKEARALPRGAQDELIEKWLGGPAALTFARNNSSSVRDKMVEVALLRDRADADIGETNRLDDWKKRVDEQADMMRGRGRAAATGRGAVKPTAFDNLRGSAMNVQGSLKNEMLNIRISPKDAALGQKIAEANAPRSGTMSAIGAALGGTPTSAPVAPGAAASIPAGSVTAGGGFTEAMGERAAAAASPATPAPVAPTPTPTASAPASSPVGGGGVPTGGSFTPLGAAPSAAPTAAPDAAPAPGAAASAAPFKLDRNWRAQPISARQKSVLIKNGIDEAKLPTTFGEASDLMDEMGTKTGKFEPITDTQKKALLAAGMPEADLPKSKFAASQDLGEIKKAAGGAVPAGGSFTPVTDGSAPAAKDAWRANAVSKRQASSLKKGVKNGLITQEQVDAITNQGDASDAIKLLKAGKRVPKTVSTGAKAAATAATAATGAATGAPASAATATATTASRAAPAAAAAAGAAPTSLVGMLGPTKGATAPAAAAGGNALGRVGSKLAGLGRFLGPLAAIYGAYQVVDLLKQGTLDAADERRLKMMQALGAVGGGAQQQQQMNDQMRQMRFMADMTAIQNQQGKMQSRNQSISDQALSSLLRGHEASLQALALPSQPSVAEVMARM